MKITGTLDIEAANWDRFSVAATYMPGSGSRIYRSIGELVDFLLAHPKSTWWAHCGGNYDFLAIAEELRRRGIPCSIDLAGSRVSRVVGGGIVLRDSWPLLPLSLDVLCELVGADVPKLGLRCICGSACDGFCTLRPNDLRKAVSAYCAADARTLYEILIGWKEIGTDLGLELRGTLGGTAWATAKARLNLPDADLPGVAWRRVRAAYFGGRVTVCRPRAKGRGWHWDLNAAYPAALASTPVPAGEWCVYTGKRAQLCYGNEAPGVYVARVDVPSNYLPPLPARVKGRMTFPIGEFRGCWTLPELQAAEARGTRIIKVEWAHVWERSEAVFAPLIEEWWAIRKRVGKKTALGKLLRLLPNTVTGKLAEGPHRRTAKMFPDQIKWCEGKHPCSRTICNGACGAYEQLDLWGQVWGVPFYRPSTSGHIQWAAYLTAATRERWLAGAENHGHDLVYGDTDSIWTTRKEAPTPSTGGLGHWEYKHAWTDFECAAPRQYKFTKAGEATVVTAGAQLTEADWLRGEATRSRGVLSFTEAAAAGRGLFAKKTTTWTVSTRGKEEGRYGDRALDVDAGITLPLPYGG